MYWKTVLLKLFVCTCITTQESCYQSAGSDSIGLKRGPRIRISDRLQAFLMPSMMLVPGSHFQLAGLQATSYSDATSESNNDDHQTSRGAVFYLQTGTIERCVHSLLWGFENWCLHFSRQSREGHSSVLQWLSRRQQNGARAQQTRIQCLLCVGSCYHPQVLDEKTETPEGKPFAYSHKPRTSL